MAIDADLNGVIANVRNGVGHWKRMATRLARWHGRWRSHKPGQALVEQNVARPLLRVRNTGTTGCNVTVRNGYVAADYYTGKSLLTR